MSEYTIMANTQRLQKYTDKLAQETAAMQLSYDRGKSNLDRVAQSRRFWNAMENCRLYHTLARHGYDPVIAACEAAAAAAFAASDALEAERVAYNIFWRDAREIKKREGIGKARQWVAAKLDEIKQKRAGMNHAADNTGAPLVF